MKTAAAEWKNIVVLSSGIFSSSYQFILVLVLLQLMQFTAEDPPMPLLTAGNASSPLLTCYTTFSPPIKQIDPFLCTHLILIGDCWLDDDLSIRLPSEDRVAQLVSLKQTNPALRILITFMPENRLMSQLVLNRTTMDEMASDVLDYLTRNQLDGFDLDWEFPVWGKDARSTDKFGFTVLLDIMRAEFDLFHLRRSTEGRKLELFVTVAAPFDIVEVAYNVRALNRHADYVQVMNYDFHVWSSNFPLTGLNAPLRAQKHEVGAAALMNSQESTEFWLSLGLSPSKLVFGIPTYGRGFALIFPFWHTLYAPADDGFLVDNPMACRLENGTDFKTVWNKPGASPYIYFRRKWISYENERSVTEKTVFARSLQIAGVMVFGLHTEDRTGSCGRGKYPLINAIKSVLFNGTTSSNAKRSSSLIIRKNKNELNKTT